jgi:hypothetical protein
MNHFILDEDEWESARMHCDKHVVKMPVETAQMMASALRRAGATDQDFITYGVLTKGGTPYKGGYARHPCTIWTGDSLENFEWAYRHGVALCGEYTHRYSKTHACANPINGMYLMAKQMTHQQRLKWDECDLTPFAQAMPDRYKVTTGWGYEEAIEAYRSYYIGDKHSIAQWERGRPAPHWYEEAMA